MRYTFGEAKKMLASAGMSSSGTDIGGKINIAVQALAGLNGWEFMRKLVRTISASPVFSLPQGTAGLVRACINGRPASIHATDYQFLHSGPGDLSKPPPGFRFLRSSEIADVGYSPLEVDLQGPTKFIATSPYIMVEKPGTGYRPQPDITITGIDASGCRVSYRCPVVQDPSGVPDDKFFDGPDFVTVEHVVLGDATDEHITLFGMCGNTKFTAAHYHPAVKVPLFHRYQVVGCPGPYDILAEVRIEPLPLVNDEDVVPLPSLEPVRSMMLYEANMNMNEMQTAEGYKNQAETWLAKMQIADNTIQTPVVVNTLFEGSEGESSEFYQNL